MKCTKILFFFLFAACCNFIYGQEANVHQLDSFAGKYITAVRAHEKQRAFLVSDKYVYTSGESIWFKAFLLNTVSQKRDTKNNFLFVDVVNEKDSVIRVVILDALNQQLNSRIMLPETIASGYYWLRAYTKQMAEGDTNNICVKPIVVINKKSDDDFSLPVTRSSNQDKTPVVSFYPEGGNIITGVNSTVALMVSDKNGTPLSIDGYIKDNRDTIIEHFTTNKNGIGKFMFEPSGFRKYNAFIRWGGKEVSYPLPPFNFYSGQLSVTREPAGYKVRVLLGDSIYRKDAVTNVIAVSKDSLIFAGIGAGQYEVFVAKQQFPEGITTFYLFDEGFNILSERSVYVHNNNLQIQAATDKAVYGRRDKVTLNISMTGSEQQSVSSFVTVAVTDSLLSGSPEELFIQGMDYSSEGVDNTILANKGYFNEDEIDMAMLLQQTTYKKYDRIQHLPADFKVDSLLYIKGVVLNEKKEASANKVVTILSNSGIPFLYTDTTDNTGRFCFPFQNYSDSMQFALEVRNLKGQPENDRIVLDDFVYPEFKTPVAFKQFLPVSMKDIKKYISLLSEDELNERDKKLLPNVTVKDRVKPLNYNVLKRVSASSTILTSDDLDERNSVGNEVLNVGGMHMLNGFLVINGLTSIKAPDAGSEPLLIVEGAQVSASSGPNGISPVMNYLNGLNPKDIDFIEILKGGDGANFGVRGGNGVILINLLSTRRDLNTGENKFKLFYAKGVSNPVLFKNVDYNLKDTKAAEQADNRSTLYWNGNLPLDNIQKTTVTFYTSDIPATYKITITGITAKGDIICKTISFKSK